MRKTIQISMQIDSVGKYLVLALCDDGTIWQLDGLYEGKSKWHLFPTPPSFIPKPVRE
jgi:hypothetical protein